MFDAFWGEFLVSPCPVELTLNYCSHKCAFCFANLNKPDRSADIPKIQRFLAGLPERTSVPARLVQAGYPVLFSNRVDPFANSNSKQALPLLETMTELGIPVAFQTRGGRGIDEALGFLPPSVWYISISQLDDDIRKRIEPGAPAIEARFELMEKLVDSGHRVVLGLNPLVQEWLPDPGPLLERAQEAGAEGVWIEALHLSHRQVSRMTERERTNMGEPLLQLGRKLRMPPEVRTFHHYTVALARELDLEPYYVGQHRPSGFFRPFLETYEPCFPTIQEFINDCAAILQDGDVIDFETFAQWMCGRLPFPDEPVNILHYIGAKHHDLLAKNNFPPKISYRDLLRVVWCEPVFPYSPAALRCFAYAARWDGDGWIQYVDQQNLPLMLYTNDPIGFDGYYSDPEKMAESLTGEAAARA
jgi:DNA repair photolyase